MVNLEIKHTIECTARKLSLPISTIPNKIKRSAISASKQPLKCFWWTHCVETDGLAEKRFCTQLQMPSIQWGPHSFHIGTCTVGIWKYWHETDGTWMTVNGTHSTYPKNRSNIRRDVTQTSTRALNDVKTGKRWRVCGTSKSTHRSIALVRRRRTTCTYLIDWIGGGNGHLTTVKSTNQCFYCEWQTCKCALAETKTSYWTISSKLTVNI